MNKSTIVLTVPPSPKQLETMIRALLALAEQCRDHHGMPLATRITDALEEAADDLGWVAHDEYAQRFADEPWRGDMQDADRSYEVWRDDRNDGQRP